MEFTLNYKVQAKDKETSLVIMAALEKLSKHISPEDLKLFSEKIEANPLVLQAAKKYL